MIYARSLYRYIHTSFCANQISAQVLSVINDRKMLDENTRAIFYFWICSPSNFEIRDYHRYSGHFNTNLLRFELNNNKLIILYHRNKTKNFSEIFRWHFPIQETESRKLRILLLVSSHQQSMLQKHWFLLVELKELHSCAYQQNIERTIFAQ